MQDDTQNGGQNGPHGTKADPIAALDLNRLWQSCGGTGAVPERFEDDLREALSHYHSGPDRLAFLPAKERKRNYDRLQKSLKTLAQQLEEMHDFLEFEIDAVSIDFEPDDTSCDETGDNLPWVDQGLSYAAYKADQLQDCLIEYAAMVDAARRHHDKARGKPKQNTTLEQTILRLGHVYSTHTQAEPMSGFHYDEMDAKQPYGGRFFDFLHGVIWSVNGREYPSGQALGDAARRAFGLRT